MALKLPKLPYKEDALEPYISKATVMTHYHKHHNGYVEKTNKLLEGSSLAGKPLETIIQAAWGPLFDNAAQVWNHTFYWKCLSPKGGGTPSGRVGSAIERTFGSFDEFHRQFTEAATHLFGSGWIWLVQSSSGDELQILPTKDADNPLTRMQTPLLCCDVWEHAYYLDHKNLRAKYVDAFWKLVNWEFVEKQFQTRKELVRI